MRLRYAMILLPVCALGACGSRPRGGPSQEIAELKEQRAAALTQHDGVEASRLTMDLNYRLELQALVEAGADSDEAIARLNRKYAVLTSVLKDEEARLARGGDTEALSRTLPIAYNEHELDAVRSVFSTYGNLYINIDTGSEVRLGEVPWSGYWYPLAGTDLFGPADSPLAKLDRLNAALGRPGGIVKWEKDHHDGIPPSAWEGFCSSWAAASVLTNEPTRPLEYKGIVFSPADQKALLTKVHELYPTRQFGIRYNGDQDTDGTFQDLRPEAFQLLVQHVLGTLKQPLLADTDPGVEVWTKPLYRMRWVMKPDPTRSDAFLVSAYPWFVNQRQAASDAPTADQDYLTAVYEYRLYVDKQTQQNGKYLVIAGEWLNKSLGAHPDYMLLPTPGGAWGSQNTALQASLDTVRELFAKGSPR